jgi:hypothetical protein
MTATATTWRTCPTCGASFEQPDDPGRKRVYCSRACQQAAYRARRCSGADQRHRGGQRRTGRQEWRSDWRHQRADAGGPGAGQRPGGGQQRSRRQQWRSDHRSSATSAPIPAGLAAASANTGARNSTPPPGGANRRRPVAVT